jgi:hypothetical protein
MYLENVASFLASSQNRLLPGQNEPLAYDPNRLHNLNWLYDHKEKLSCTSGFPYISQGYN